MAARRACAATYGTDEEIEIKKKVAAN